MSMLNSVHSSRRPAALKASDYDHEIHLVDHTLLRISTTSTPGRSRSPSQAPSDHQASSVGSTTSRKRSDVILRKKNSIQKEIVRRRYSKYQDRRLSGHSSNDDGQSGDEDVGDRPEVNVEIPTPINEDEEHRGRPQSKPAQKERESAIDILYENQRGGFLCGIPLFSSKALGNADPSPWTNVALKTSATDTTNAQVPDPSWEWVWKEWVINHDDNVDEEGWEYSFMFSRKFSWHGPAWWNSFVRRRAWIRKRAKCSKNYGHEAHMLNSNYFTIHPTTDRSRSSSRIGSNRDSRYSITNLAKQAMDLEEEEIEICDIEHLMVALKLARIDREKTEAVENFIKHGGDNLYYLQERMHDIMAQFIFQASRKLLLTHLSRTFDDAIANQKQCQKSGKEEISAQTRRTDNLEAAIKHADEEVQRLEFWSDQKEMVRDGDTKNALDKNEGWGEKWAGLDSSAPTDKVVRDLPGKQDIVTAFEDVESDRTSSSDEKMEKGKGKEEL